MAKKKEKVEETPEDTPIKESVAPKDDTDSADTTKKEEVTEVIAEDVAEEEDMEADDELTLAEGELEEDATSEEESEPLEPSSQRQLRKKVETTAIIRLFNRWSFDDVQVSDISLQNYINLTPVITPHSGGKHCYKKFWKTEHISIIERFINKIMTPGLVGKRIKGRGASHSMGKKGKIINMIYNTFSIIEKKTGENPIQVLVKAIENAAPREETTKISLGGISYQQAVDIAPQRRLDLAIKIIIQQTVGTSYNNIKTIDEILANELILCARNDSNSRAIKRKDEMERVAISAR